MEKYTVHIDNDLDEKMEIIHSKLDKYGLVILPNIIPEKKCDKYFEQSKEWLKSISENLTDDPKTWINSNLPYGPRIGMYQSLIGHSPVAWKMRTKMYPIFKSLWKHVTEKEEDLISSIDGATIYPPKVPKRKVKDWPHIDQTVSEDILKSFQGQVVLTNTTASFRCTPKSHLRHDEIIKKFKIDHKKGFHKFSDQQVENLKKDFKNWQIPIHVRKGSVILWKSVTIHSAKRSNSLKDDWRCVYYVCMRPKSHLSKRNLNTIKKAATTGRTTNHTIGRLLPKSPRYSLRSLAARSTRSSYSGEKKDPSIKKYLDNPELIVTHKLTPFQKRLVNLEG